jgi:hypothetical protein
VSPEPNQPLRAELDRQTGGSNIMTDLRRRAAGMKRAVKSAAILVAVVALLALASYLTTSIIWDGGFPSGEIRLNVRDPEGQAVKGAVLLVYRAGTRDLAFEYPLDNHVAGRDLVSDEKGRITAIRKRGGLQFGGHAWQLFWVIPMGAKAPEYDCEVMAEGFKPLKFQVWRLFDSPHKTYEDFPKTKLKLDGEEIELPIYEHTFTLER